MKQLHILPAVYASFLPFLAIEEQYSKSLPSTMPVKAPKTEDSFKSLASSGDILTRVITLPNYSTIMDPSYSKAKGRIMTGEFSPEPKSKDYTQI